ncbi:putative MFS family arabinose efflux permease [Paucimonas lemoignei]|uniref:Putative MFS family arabinose efflux permease n=1 Tax=Paucimonas lemoignei TaxID=29443 RepID=A0A4R3HQV4_PAULE|nr:MFS transporter [Paucimonas lemoignei]TCS35144.1 putative MFS family arabinose efflux permease [Paucimonas lemoignei]
MQSTRLWTRDFVIVSGVNFLLGLVFYMLIVVIGSYAIKQYGASFSQAGLVAGIFVIGIFLGRLVIGQLVDVLGQKKTMIIGMIAFTLTSCLYFLSNSVMTLLAVRFVHGFSLGVASTAAATAVAHIIPHHRKAEGIGYYSLSTTLSSASGPFIGLWLLQHMDFNWIFAACLLVAIVGLFAATQLRLAAKGASRGSLKDFQFSLANLMESKAIPIALVTFLCGLCYASVLTFINAYAIELDLVTAASFFFIVYSAVVLCSRPLTGKLLDRKGSKYVVYPCCVFLAAGMVLLATAQSGTALLLAGALVGLGFGNLQSALNAIAIKVVAPERMGLATSTFYIFLDASLGFGPYLLGLLIAQTGYRNLYWSMAVLAAACMLAFYLLHGRHVARLREQLARST